MFSNFLTQVKVQGCVSVASTTLVTAKQILQLHRDQTESRIGLNTPYEFVSMYMSFITTMCIWIVIFINIADGKKTPLDFLIDVRHSSSEVVGDEVDHYPGLTMVLSHKVELNHVGLDKRTPLLRMVEGRREDLMKILVSETFVLSPRLAYM